MLPNGISPMLLPDTPDQARYLLLLLELGLYPTAATELPVEQGEIEPVPRKAR